MTNQWQYTIRIAAITLSFFMFLAVLSGCMTASHPPSPDTLRVGLTPNYRPIVYKQNRQLVGLEVDMAKALAADLGRKVVFIEMSWEKLIPALEDNKIDIIMSGMSITPGRAVRMAFSKPYLKIGQTALVRSDDAIRFDDPRLVLITRKKIGVEKGTTGDIFVQQNCPRAQRVVFSSAERAAKALAENKLEFVIHDSPVIWELAAEFEVNGLVVLPFTFTNENLAWAVRRDNTRLLKEVNTVLNQWNTDGRMKQFINQWFAWLRK